ncbi:MAG: hypothetical protein LBN34_01230 [Clostridiales Family XIII bacterium]|jgi:hypothetical protein|nr:hypothetical protein [Clostridiales Family XIII bacterium]
MERKSLRNIQIRTVSILVAIVISAQVLGGCAPISEAFHSIFPETPTAADTYLSIAEADEEIVEAMKEGKTEITLNIANVTEQDIKNIAINMSPFWGTPTEYSIDRTFEDVEGIVEGKAVDVLTVTSHLELSNNYYVVQNIRNKAEIPEGNGEAVRIAEALPAIITEIFGENGEVGPTPYEQALATHDWLVSQLEYDDTIDEFSTQNGSFGALVGKRTMCVGYAEAFELILRCNTDIETQMVIGDSMNRDSNGNYSGNWVGHAWNVVKMDGGWYQVDATFDDPVGNTEGTVEHGYFGQSDEVMKADHQWEADFAPVCDAGNFFYFRKSGLMTSDQAEFETVVRNILKNGDPTQIEVATSGVTIDERDLRFIFSANENVQQILWDDYAYGDITVVNIEPQY